MDELALQGLGPHADAQSHQRAMQYFEQLKSTTDGWKLCASALTSNAYDGQDHIKFFCFKVIEEYLKTSYVNSSAEGHTEMKAFLRTFMDIQLQRGRPEASFLRNKAAQVLALVFIVDYPSRWESFLTDILALLSYGVTLADLYLRTLMAIDSEVVDREIIHTVEECERNTQIKDHMRLQCVPAMVESWFHIVTTYEASNTELVSLCLQVIGAYVSWIDIGLIANEKFVSILLRFMTNVLLRESACDCIYEIILKGMEPASKMDLIQSFMSVLESAGILKTSDNDDECDYLAKLSKLINGIGLQLILCWQRLLKADDKAKQQVALQMLEAKVPLMLTFLGHEDDDVSGAVAEFAHDYITVLKQVSPLQPHQRDNVKNLMIVVMGKMKFDDSYNHESEGEDEAMFLAYRKELRDIFNNLGALDAELVLTTIQNFFTQTLSNWREAKYQDVELALSLLHSLAECLPSSKGQIFTGEGTKVTRLQEMMRVMVSSGVSYYQHSAVILQFFENVARYDKFFNIEPRYVADVLMAFLDERGLRNTSPHVRSRTAYLFSRFVRTVNRQHLAEYLEEMLKRCHDLLVLHTPAADNGHSNHQMSPSDQLFMYETAGVLIVHSSASADKKQQMMRHLLSPIVGKYDDLLQAMMQEQDEQRQLLYAQCLSQALNYASRTSKGFSVQNTVAQCGCVEVYTESLEVFLRGLDVPVHRPILHAGIRQFLHRMVVCLDSQVLRFIPMAIEKLLLNADARELHDFIPLINQVVTKFKAVICPYLAQVFMPIVETIFNVLSAPLDARDQVSAAERSLLQRSYYSFISTLITNDTAQVLTGQAADNLHTVLMTVTRGAVESPDVTCQKTCFNILTKLVTLWGGPESGLNGFVDFIYKQIVPACFMAPLAPSFNLSDAQTVLVVNETASCMKAILDKRGEECINFLNTNYLPTLNMNPDLCLEYTQAMHSDVKIFRKYLKAFFTRAKS
ncbi:hypothetical protein CAPTEDRAFT_150306 [Capitella teleta]|uniref:Exportin-T n=1 Tax=Capitella teleta TaxID=283909 RepID=R7V7H2_CAPTE|nr:hypothetical protein CAPTEDRAFT_150306 [Capitella teleta]|eukprot:ELU12326.1 hypothetical protein CAPTEDRAFT_150306 [Capitella teleta]